MFDSGITARQLIDELKGEVDVAIEIPDSSYVSWLNSLEQLLYSEIIKEQKERIVTNPSEILNEFGVDSKKSVFELKAHSSLSYSTKYTSTKVVNVYTEPTVTEGKIVMANLYGSQYGVDIKGTNANTPIELITASSVLPAFNATNEVINWEFVNDGDSDVTLYIIEETISNADKPRFEDIYAIYDGKIQLIKTSLTSGDIFPYTYYKNGNDVGISASGNGEYRVIYNVRPKVKTNTESNVMLPIEFIDLAKAKLRGEAYKLANEDALAGKWINDYNVLLENFKAWVDDKTPAFGI